MPNKNFGQTYIMNINKWETDLLPGSCYPITQLPTIYSTTAFYLKFFDNVLKWRSLFKIASASQVSVRDQLNLRLIAANSTSVLHFLPWWVTSPACQCNTLDSKRSTICMCLTYTTTFICSAIVLGTFSSIISWSLQHVFVLRYYYVVKQRTPGLILPNVVVFELGSSTCFDKLASIKWKIYSTVSLTHNNKEVEQMHLQLFHGKIAHFVA